MSPYALVHCRALEAERARRGATPRPPSHGEIRRPDPLGEVVVQDGEIAAQLLRPNVFGAPRPFGVLRVMGRNR